MEQWRFTEPIGYPTEIDVYYICTYVNFFYQYKNGQVCWAELFCTNEKRYHLPLMEEGNTRLHEATNVI